MPANIFFDTNILVYAFSPDEQKNHHAAMLLQQRGTISVQVMNELNHVMLRKLKLPWSTILSFFALIESVCDIRPLTLQTHQLGRQLAQQYQIGLYDAMIIAAAQQAGCHTLYSEDMHHGLNLNGLTIINPFKQSTL